MQTLVVYGGNRDGVNAVGIAIKIALVTGHGAIATGEYEYGTFSVPAVLYAVEEGLVNNVAWTFHGLAVIRGAPTAGVNVDIMEAVVERCGFINVRDWTGENAHACYLCLIGEADTADVILGSRDLAGAAGTVAVIGKDRFWEGRVIVEVVGVLGVLGGMRSDSDAKDRKTYKVLGKVIAFVVDAVVDKGCDDALTGDADLPEPGDIHHVLGELFVDDVPLLGEEGVREAEAGTNGGGGGIGRNRGRGTLRSLAWVLVLKQVDGGEGAAGTIIAGLDGRLCAGGVVAGEDGVAMRRGVLGGAEEPGVGEVADLADELEAKAEIGDALGDGGGGGGRIVIENEVVERHMITLGGDGAGGDEGGEQDEGDGGRVSACHPGESKRWRSRACRRQRLDLPFSDSTLSTMAVARKRTRRSLSPVPDSDDERPRPPPPAPRRTCHVPAEHEFPEGPDLQVIGETDPLDNDRGNDVPVRVLTDFSIYDHSTLDLVPIASLIELSHNPRLSFSAAGCVKAWIDNDDEDDDDDEEEEDKDQDDAEQVRENSDDNDPAAEDRIQRLKLTPIKRFSFHDRKQCHRRLDRCPISLPLHIPSHLPQQYLHPHPVCLVHPRHSLATLQALLYQLLAPAPRPPPGRLLRHLSSKAQLR